MQQIQLAQAHENKIHKFHKSIHILTITHKLNKDRTEEKLKTENNSHRRRKWL